MFQKEILRNTTITDLTHQPALPAIDEAGLRNGAQNLFPPLTEDIIAVLAQGDTAGLDLAQAAIAGIAEGFVALRDQVSRFIMADGTAVDLGQAVTVYRIEVVCDVGALLPERPVVNRVVVVTLRAVTPVRLGEPVQQIVIEALILLGDLIEDAGNVVYPVVVVTELRLN